MRWLLALVIATSPLLARDKQEVRHWQEGTIQCVRTYPVGLYSELAVEIVTDKVVYSMTSPRRAFLRHRLELGIDLKPGAVVKFALSGRNGWIIDDSGVERKLTMTSAAVLRSGDKLTCFI